MNAKYVAMAAVAMLAVVGACGGVGNSQQHLRSAVEAQRPTLDECYAEALERDESAQGQMSLVLYVDKADGRIQDVQVAESGIHDAGLQECVQTALVGVTLEETPKVDMEVSYTFEFEPEPAT